MTLWRECRDCRRPLRSETSQALGYGPECAEKHGLKPKKRRRAARPRVRRLPAPVTPDPDALPGQTELELFHHQATLWSL
ncbi:DUF6011 domain-containing protein [Streptomyces sp. NPDC058985]|uniref:DUF6011 domain-containing protein n=1 Tax=Streptomyces sp. NPDC058985 TaxID=3346684 RepID=UPI0036A77000